MQVVSGFRCMCHYTSALLTCGIGIRGMSNTRVVLFQNGQWCTSRLQSTAPNISVPSDDEKMTNYRFILPLTVVDT